MCVYMYIVFIYSVYDIGTVRDHFPDNNTIYNNIIRLKMRYMLGQ